MTTEWIPEPFERNSCWVPLRAGWITAVGAPSQQRLATWRAAGATDVLTLQRSGEYRPWLPEICREQGLCWRHLPLSGRRLDQPGDAESLARVSSLLPIWDEPCRVVVHCAAGLHRTGAICYLLLRHSGLERNEAIERLRLARALTADELCGRGRSGVLADRMDEHLRHGYDKLHG